jgi:hypothetical protein
VFPKKRGPDSGANGEDDPNTPCADTLEFLLDVLSKKYNDPEQIRDHMAHHYLKEVEDGLRLNGYTRACNVLLARASKPFGSWKKDQYVSANDLKRTILSSDKFSNHRFCPSF